MNILDLSAAPTEPIARLLWLSGVHEQVKKELDDEFSRCYYEARLQRQFDAALAVKMHSKKVALAYTRHENESRGRTVRWSDKLDQTSTAYDPSAS